MPGYEILEHKNLKTYKEDGIVPNETRIGFLDFLREMKNYADELSPLSSFIVVGIEEVLYMTKPEERLTISREIHNILQTAASALVRKLIQVQIDCKGVLVKGDSLWLEYRGERLPIDLIFGSTMTNNVRGVPVYITSFNLSS